MELRETLFSKSFSVESENGYSTALDFMNRLSESYRVYEKKNTYETDGPVKRATLIFDVVDALDEFAQICINFSMVSENETLYVDILAEFVLRVKEGGFFTEIFTEFYLSNVFPVMRRVSDQRVKELNALIAEM